MHSPTDCLIQSPVAPDQVDVLQHVFDTIRVERRMTKESPEALDLARLILHLYFDGVHLETALLDAARAGDKS